MGALVALSLIATLAIVLTPAAQTASFTVTSTTDAVDTSIGDGICATAGGVCTLRAAIQEANANTTDADTITLPAGTYTLTVAGVNEEAAARGDLDLLGPTTITGAGSGSTIIDANGLDRAFDGRGSSFTLSNVTVRNGTKSGISTVGDVSISNVVITGNTNDGIFTSSNGGGIEHRQGSPFGLMTLTNVTVTNNTATGDGGGISEQSSGGTWTNILVEGNTSSTDGGGIYISQNFVAVTILDSVVRGNTSSGGSAGGIHSNGSSSRLVVRRTEISGNTASGGGSNGGGIVSISQLTAENVTVSGNASNGVNGRGGGIALLGSTGHRLEHVTITNNTATTTPSGLLVTANVPDIATLENSIVAGNGAGVECEGDTFFLEGHNLQDSDGGCGFDIVDDAPGLAPLADNGGFSKTHGLQSDSPAIDAASSCTATTDQRGTARPVGAACDLGAFEGVVSSNFQLSVSKSGNGTVTSSPSGISCGSTCSATYTSGTTVTLTSSANASWSGCDSSTATSCTVTMTGARAVSATFATSYTLTVSKSGSGTVTSSPSGISCGSTCSATYASGTTAILTSSSDASWSGCDSSTATSCTVAMTSARTVSATFATAYTLTIRTTGSGSGSVECDGGCSFSYASGRTVTLRAFAAAGSVFAGWSGCDSTAGSVCSVTMSSDRVVTATFSNTPPTARITGPTSARARVVTTFSATSSSDAEGGLVAYRWSFGDGGSATGVEVPHSYDAAGTYVVTLTVTDLGGRSASTTTSIVVRPPNAAPVPAFTASRPDPKTPLKLRLDATASSDADGRIDRFAWRRGSTSIGSTPVITTTFRARGTYVISLAVTDNDGATTVKTVTLTLDDRLTVIVQIGEGVGVADAGKPTGSPAAAVTVSERVGAVDKPTITPVAFAQVNVTEGVGAVDRPTLPRPRVAPRRPPRR